MTQWLIYISQGLNRLHGGDADQMFSARCWEQRRHWYYGWWQRRLDNDIPFLRSWKYDGKTHCESCLQAEIDRDIEFLSRNGYEIREIVDEHYHQ